MSDVLRFKGSLVSGYWPDNPEPLVRCSHGDFCLYSDYAKLQAENEALKAKLSKISEAMELADDLPYDALYLISNIMDDNNE